MALQDEFLAAAAKWAEKRFKSTETITDFLLTEGLVTLLSLVAITYAVSNAGAIWAALCSRAAVPEPTPEEANPAVKSQPQDANPIASRQKQQGQENKNKKKKRKKGSAAAAVAAARHPKAETTPRHELFLRMQRGHRQPLVASAWSEDGSLLATACDGGRVRVVYLNEKDKSGSPRFAEHDFDMDFCAALAFASAAPVLLVSLGRANTVVPIVVSSTYKGADSLKCKHAIPVTHSDAPSCLFGMCFPGVPSSLTVVTSALGNRRDCSVMLLDRQGGPVARIDSGLAVNNAVAVSPNGRFIAVCGFLSEPRLWQVEAGRDKRGMPATIRSAHKSMALRSNKHSKPVTGIAFGWDALSCFTASRDGTIRAWDLRCRAVDGEPACSAVLASEGRQPYSHLFSYCPPVWRHDDNKLLEDGHLRFRTLEVAAGAARPYLVAVREPGVLEFVAVSANPAEGDAAAAATGAGGDQGVVGPVVASIEFGAIGLGALTSLSFSPDGTQIATTFQGDRTLKLWSVPQQFVA